MSVGKNNRKVSNHRLTFAGCTILLWGIVGCTSQIQSDSSIAASTSDPVVETPSTTEPPSSGSTATNAATAAESIAAAPGFQQTTLISNLEYPWGVAWLPDGTMLITERAGRLRVVSDGSLSPTPISGVPNIFAENQGGLMDVAIHPRFAENRLVYFTYSHGTNSANRTRVARATFDGNTVGNWQVIFEVAQTKQRGQHFGSRIVWLPDETLLVSIGDGGNPPISLNGELIRQQAQNRGSHFGKVIRLKDDGSIPPDNPFVNTANAEPAVWSYGHRNIQGMAFDSTKNRVWATEHGSRGGDEVNLVQKGENYGWPVATHSREYSGGLISPEKSLPGMLDPKLIWTPSIAPSGLAFYDGDRFPQWRGQLFAGGLVSRDIRRIELDESGGVVNEVSIPIGQRVRDVRQGPDGLLYVLTDEPNGQLIQLEPSGG
ncbi:MAG: PQQ-dependent sugar dehydrogenase [Microcoleaceae cyanobacterium]